MGELTLINLIFYDFLYLFFAFRVCGIRHSVILSSAMLNSVTTHNSFELFDFVMLFSSSLSKGLMPEFDRHGHSSCLESLEPHSRCFGRF